MAPPAERPEDLLAKPSPARMYDLALGGKQNLREDRHALEESKRLSDHVDNALLAHHQAVHRVVRHLARQGVEQFLLVGTGLPSTAGAHTTIHELTPLARVVYAERDPFALAHARAFMARTSDRIRIVECDLRHPEDLLADAEIGRFLDWDRPVAAGILSMHEIPVGDRRALDAFRSALAPGSFLWLTTVSMDGFDAQTRAAVEQMGMPVHFRTVAQSAALLDGLDVVEPGLAWATQWHPDGTEIDMPPEKSSWLVAVTRL